MGGKYLKERVTRPGVGAALVAISKRADLDPAEAITMGARIYYGVTAVARFKAAVARSSSTIRWIRTRQRWQDTGWIWRPTTPPLWPCCSRERGPNASVCAGSSTRALCRHGPAHPDAPL
ncbi:hypothetical protein [Verrucomicrobium spinosum]|uniref:hypothetical protein n=1 Tax=Verrucomicrobium spinosum TaxID=2736 RepID=UPI0012E16BDA|nr:hypothetical protein [Verrucomicrobium spinosum]